MLGRDPLALYDALFRRYGEAVRVPFLPRHSVYVLAGPDAVEHVLVANQANYVKAPTYRPLMEILGHGLLTNEGDAWVRQRRIVQPMFAKRHIAAFAPVFAGAASDTLDRWDDLAEGARIDASAAMNALAFEAVGRALFGADLSGESEVIGPALTQALASFEATVFNPLYWTIPGFERVPIPSRRRGEAAKASLNGVLDRLLAARRVRERDSADPDLLEMLLAARDPETGEAMPEQQVRDEAMTFLLAGHETTSNALSWTLLLLSRYPAVRERLEAEVDEVLAGRSAGADDADKLEWTTAVLCESMRLWPPAWTIEREALGDDEVEGYPIPAGSFVATPPYLVHRHPAHWPNPEGFDPERFLPGRDAGRHSYAYLPFGGGRRQCVGGSFAMLEATLVLATIAQRYRLDLVAGTRVAAEPTVTLRPRDGIPMTLHRRLAAEATPAGRAA